MTIEKGAPWGSVGKVPESVSCVDTDREFASVPDVCVLCGGNLHEALGRPTPKKPGEDCMLLPVDAMRVAITRRSGVVDEIWAASEVQVGSWFSRRGLSVVTNTGHLGRLHIAPRAHPNDGVLDTVEIDRRMPMRERLVGRLRARTGTHVPHPLLRTGRTHSFTITRDGHERLRIDGIVHGDWTRLTVTVEPDRWLVAV